ncbi:hypothetical protein V2J09_016045 [Rumex salicifolius]
MEADDRTIPLLQAVSRFPPSRSSDEDIAPLLTPYEAQPSQNRRLVSLDVFRGLTIALMILVDDVGGAFPSLNHSPWFGVTIADFVMPFFLFIVGVSIGLVLKKVPSKSMATKKVIFRVIRLFLLGVFLQGGFFHGHGNLTYGVDVEKIRWLGILQRIAIGYLLASISEIFLVNNTAVDSLNGFVRRYYIQWIGVLLLCTIYISLVYGIYVPNWHYQASVSNVTMVECGVRGSLDPPCNVVGFIDRIILGENHLYQRPVYRRKEECSINSPDYGPLPSNAPGWCLAPFDPEGILSSLMASVTCLVGLHYGHVLVHFKDHMQRIILWSFTSFLLLVLGLVLHLLGMPLSKPLYTLSYMCVTAGASGFLFSIIYYLLCVVCSRDIHKVDVQHIQKPTILFQWMGMNALIIYALAACDIFAVLVQGFYWRSPENNLIDIAESLLQGVLHSKRWGILSFVLLEIVLWGLFAGYLHSKGKYLKL